MCGDDEGNDEGNDECLEVDANVVLTRQNCRVNTVGNSSMTIYNKHVLERARHESEGAGALQYEIVKEIIYYE